MTYMRYWFFHVVVKWIIFTWNFLNLDSHSSVLIKLDKHLQPLNMQMVIQKQNTRNIIKYRKLMRSSCEIWEKWHLIFIAFGMVALFGNIKINTCAADTTPKTAPILSFYRRKHYSVFKNRLKFTQNREFRCEILDWNFFFFPYNTKYGRNSHWILYDWHWCCFYFVSQYFPLSFDSYVQFPCNFKFTEDGAVRSIVLEFVLCFVVVILSFIVVFINEKQLNAFYEYTCQYIL